MEVIQVSIADVPGLWWMQAMQWSVLIACVLNLVSIVLHLGYVRYLQSSVSRLERQKGWADRDLREMHAARDRVMEHCQALVADARHVGLSASCWEEEIGAIEEVWRGRVDPFKEGDRGCHDRVVTSFESSNLREGGGDDAGPSDV
jgi:hypothetical protein